MSKLSDKIPKEEFFMNQVSNAKSTIKGLISQKGGMISQTDIHATQTTWQELRQIASQDDELILVQGSRNDYIDVKGRSQVSVLHY